MSETPTMGALLRRLAQNRPRHEAVIFEHRVVTYRELDQAVNRLANALHGAGIQDGSVVAILSRNSPEFLEAYYACARLGAILCPINYRLAPSEIVQVLAHSGSRLLLLDDFFSERYWDAIHPVTDMDDASVVRMGPPRGTGGQAYDEFVADGSTEEPAPPYEVTSSHPVAMLHTSGTTGLPKGALLTQQNNIWDGLAGMHHLPLTRGDRVFQAMPFMHVGGLHMLTPAALYQGIPIVLQAKWEPHEAIALIRRERCSALWLQERILASLVDAASGRGSDLASLTLVLTAAGSGSREFTDAAMRGLQLEQMRYMYGLTEAGPTVSMTQSNEELLTRPGNMGQPVFFEDVRIVDEEGQSVSTGATGEIMVRGPNVFAGYYNMPAETARTLNDGWLRTGDLVRADEEGSLYFVDRLKDMIKTGGENVYPAEVEPRLREANPELSDIAVVGVPSDQWGEEVVAFAVAKPGMTIDEERVRQRGRQHLGGFKLPRRVHFVDEIPRTPVGEKVKRQELRDMAAAGDHLNLPTA